MTGVEHFLLVPCDLSPVSLSSFQGVNPSLQLPESGDLRRRPETQPVRGLLAASAPKAFLTADCKLRF